MQNDLFRELPIRSKTEMANDIAQIIHCLHRGQYTGPLIENLKARSTFLDERVQQDVLIFVEQVQFQQAYDPWHKVTPEITLAADRLIEDLGFYLKRN